MKSLQQRSPTTTPDFSLIANRNNALHHVVAAEINFFQKEKVKDLHLQMKTLMNEQIEFYEKVNFSKISFHRDSHLLSSFRSLQNYAKQH